MIHLKINSIICSLQNTVVVTEIHNQANYLNNHTSLIFSIFSIYLLHNTNCIKNL